MKPRLPNSLGGRLTAIAGVMTLAAISVAVVVMSFTLHRFVTMQVDLRLDSQAMSILAGLRPGPGDELRIDDRLDGPPFDRPNSGWGWQVSVRGETRLRSASMRGRPVMEVASREDPPPGGKRPRPPFRTRSVSLAEGDGLHARTLLADVAGLPVEILVAAPERAISGPMREAMNPVLLSMLALGFALLLATWVQVRLGLRPLNDLRRALQAVRSGTASEIPHDQPTEIQPVANELNALLKENALGLERARRHVANLAHGLKTPLADLTLTLQAAGRAPDGTALALVGDMDRRVRHHLARARAAAVGNPARASTPLRAHVEDLASALSRIYRERALAITLAVPDATLVACEPQDLDEMIGNLLDNACKWAKTSVSVAAGPDGKSVEILVEDDGAGLSPEELGAALVPGRRLDEMQAGHGFGLPITQELAELYGGSLAIGPSPKGGLAARLVLPAPRG